MKHKITDTGLLLTNKHGGIVHTLARFEPGMCARMTCGGLVRLGTASTLVDAAYLKSSRQTRSNFKGISLIENHAYIFTAETVEQFNQLRLGVSIARVIKLSANRKYSTKRKPQ